MKSHLATKEALKTSQVTDYETQLKGLYDQLIADKTTIYANASTDVEK